MTSSAVAVVLRGRVMGSRFCRFELRTTTPDAAEAFYDAVLGRRGDAITLLPAASAARGATAHWLGHLDVSTLGGPDLVAGKLLARGALRLGPPQPDRVLLRDPGGAIVALADMTEPSRAGVAWHQLNCTDAERTATTYAELFGWSLRESIDLGPHGAHRQFAWSTEEPNAGAIGDVAGRPGVHAHWLFFFGVVDLDRALEAAQSRGAKPIGPTLLPSGVRVAVCDDPQGAAFGLMEDAFDVRP